VSSVELTKQEKKIQESSQSNKDLTRRLADVSLEKSSDEDFV